MATVTERLTDLGYAAGWAAVRALPEPVARTLFRAGADVAARRQDENSQLRRNLSRVLGVAPADVPDDLVRDALRSYARYWREAFRLPSTDHEAVAREMDRTIDGVEHLDAALEKGRGAVVALPHSANWDRGGTWLARRYGTFATVAERLKPESLYQRFLAYREGLGFTIIPHSGGGTPPLARLEEFLAGGGVVCLLGERDLRRTGVPVTFFGEPTRMPAGPARLAVQTGAPLLVAEFWYQDKESMRVRIHPPIDVSGGIEAATQAMADTFAAGIARHPEDWHMLQPLWLDDLPADRRAHLGG
ncbi:MAG TPA: phosphatidylinositol mannoside acyltransferase [Candidatus Dietzia intestinipullorum]|nr:phosphatidylinositol mannoside acyltransferase [Candidatus Dietzia intestinipullorum]